MYPLPFDTHGKLPYSCPLYVIPAQADINVQPVTISGTEADYLCYNVASFIERVLHTQSTLHRPTRFQPCHAVAD